MLGKAFSIAFRLLIDAPTKTTIRELHVERLTGRLDDVTREHVQVLSLEPEPGARTLADLTDINKQGMR